MLAFWMAGLKDGTVLSEHHPSLRSEERSAWRELERQYPGQIAWAQQWVSGQWVRMEAEGFPLVCGEQTFRHIGLSGEGERTYVYRFIRRQEPHRSLWAVVSAQGAWPFEAAPDLWACPDPATA
jgi:hypothetical protein